MNTEAQKNIDAFERGDYRLLIDESHKDKITIVDLKGNLVGHIPSEIYHDEVTAVVVIGTNGGSSIGYVVDSRIDYRIIRDVCHEEGSYSMLQQYAAIPPTTGDVRHAIETWCKQHEGCDVRVLVSFNPLTISKVTKTVKRGIVRCP